MSYAPMYIHTYTYIELIVFNNYIRDILYTTDQVSYIVARLQNNNSCAYRQRATTAINVVKTVRSFDRDNAHVMLNIADRSTNRFAT